MIQLEILNKIKSFIKYFTCDLSIICYNNMMYVICFVKNTYKIMWGLLCVIF